MMKNRQKGFTIIELLIATSVFSMLLLIILTAVTIVGKMYYKGVTNAKTQEVARRLAEDISQQLQYSSDAPAPKGGLPLTFNSGDKLGFCVGEVRYIIVPNKLVTPGKHAIWADRDAFQTPVPCTVTDVNMDAAQPSTTPHARDLLPEDMRLLDLKILPLNSQGTLWKIYVKVAYGVDDLLVDSADYTQKISPSNFRNAVCKGSEVGSQFCSVSEIEATVYRRLAK